MSFKPEKADHAAVDEFLENVLDTYKAGDADRATCVGVIAHAMVAAAIGNETEFKNYIRLPGETLFEGV
ncbi:hypothetical protein [Bradyrhizobium sp. NBAIM08]|uniref:hypothetical protein n=1 Tax=Bradyrhizobium sp. NBAIM08 TaxID=2793815 RepID=UPI001CD3DDFD|nr:hypothetical protein [Bradyrhizobium sp. NBAIM08]